MNPLAYTLIAAPVALTLYAYAGYPLLLRAVAAARPRPVPPSPPEEWPPISITVPVYNEEAQIKDTLDSLLELDYPAEQRQILVVSDASSDGTDDMVRAYEDRGVELLRLPRRVGKTAGENAARHRLRGEIIINTDASIRIHPDAIKRLVVWFGDPGVGVASGNDVSVARAADDANAGESGYVGYEMWVRDIETRAGGIVGASGCLYAIRAELHRHWLPEGYSRDFAAALVARERGYRAVSVPDAICYVPRAASLRREYRRKVRTMVRGMETLIYKRHLLNPMRFGGFAWMLFSHKLCRWLVPVAAAAAPAAVVWLGFSHLWARGLLTAAVATASLAALGWIWPEERRLPRVLAIPAYLFAGNLAAIAAWLRVVRGSPSPIWEPTRR